MKRRISALILLCLMALSICSCGGRQVLLFLNWGEYIDETLLEEFETTYQCEVLMDLGDSNEIFYSKVRGGTTAYDVIAPSDYMVEKMYHNDMLAEIDFSKLENFSFDRRMSGVVGIANQMEKNEPGISKFFVPYLWGTWGIMYSTLIEGLENAILTNENEWASLFERSILPSGTKVAMYDSHLHDYYAVCKYLGYDHSKELDSTQLSKIYSTIKDMKYNAWGTDNIKKDIVAQNIDVGFMWTGDFLYYYCENIANIIVEALLAGTIDITKVNEMLSSLTSGDRVYSTSTKDYEIGFDIFIPEDTIAFCDNLVISKNASNYDLALEFIDFMCSRSAGINEVDAAYANAYYVSYNTPFLDVYDDIVSLKEIEFDASIYDSFLEEENSGVDPYDSTLYWVIYDAAIGIAFDKYYPKEENIQLPDGNIKKYKGDILAHFSRSYINNINRTFNNARA